MSYLWRIFEQVADNGPATPALIRGDRTTSFGELHEMALGASVALSARGVGPGTRCLMWAGNGPELASAILAVWRLGAIAVLVNDQAPTSHFLHAVAVTGPTLILVDGANFEATARVAPVPVATLRDWRKETDDAVVTSVAHADEPASIFFTSGSLGKPKGVVQSHANLLAGCRMVADHLGLRSEDRILCPIPWSFDYGYGQLLSTLLMGIAQILPTDRNPFALCSAIADQRPTVLAGLPSIFALLLRGLSPIRETDLGSLRLITNTGGKIAPAIFKDMADLFGNCEISLNYGMTETYRSAGLPLALARLHPDSVGFAYPGVSIAVIRDDGTEALPGEEGEIIHRGVGVFLGYWGDVEATARVRRPDPMWNHAGIAAPMAVFSGDIGWRDEAGFLYVKGRRDRLIKSMGVRVSPDEVETLIRNSGLVRDVAVVGLPDDMLGEKVVAAVMPGAQSGDALRALKIFARESMSSFMQPRDYRLVDAFPLTPNGKPDFAAVRALFAGNAR